MDEFPAKQVVFKIPSPNMRAIFLLYVCLIGVAIFSAVTLFFVCVCECADKEEDNPYTYCEACEDEKVNEVEEMRQEPTALRSVL